MQKLMLVVLFACCAAACQLQLRPEESRAQTNAPIPLPTMAIADRNHVLRVTLTEAKAYFDAHTAYFVDARSRIDYEEQHIAGAYYLPIIGLQDHLSELPKDKLVIAYCT
ncbi:MAG: hypothetical protein KDE54_12025 [Caldilineaceae bacterium]|nr:hypothetical protein [Caldilineaceae bacterium]MCB0144594.1 hypothetical protein [Caldilineaceae bacterium]